FDGFPKLKPRDPGLEPLLPAVYLQRVEVRTGRLLSSFRIPAYFPGGVVMSPTGMFIAFPLNKRDSATVVANAVTGRELWRMEGYGGEFRFTPDGRHLAMVMGGRVASFDVRTGKPEEPFATGVSYEVFHLLFSPDGRWLVVCGIGNVEVWDTTNRTLIIRLWNVARRYYDVGFVAPDRLAVERSDGRDRQDVLVWDLATRQPVGTWWDKLPSSIVGSPDGRTCATHGDHDIEIRDLETGRRLPVSADQAARPSLLGFAGLRTLQLEYPPVGKGQPSRYVEWDPFTGRVTELREPPAPELSYPSRVMGVPDRPKQLGDVMCKYEYDPRGYRTELVRWDAATGSWRTLRVPGCVFCPDFTSDGRRFVAEYARYEPSSEDREPFRSSLGVFDGLTGRQLYRLPASNASGVPYQVSPDGRLVAVGRHDGTLFVI